MKKTVKHARHAAENAQQWVGEVGDSLRRSDAAKWLEAGLKIGALRTGARVVGGFARRHPAVAIATVAGAGLLWYAAHRHRQRLRAEAAAAGRAIEGPALEGTELEGQILEGRAQRIGTRADSAQSAVTPTSD